MGIREKQRRESGDMFEEFLELFSQLSRWQRFQIRLFIKWSAMQRHWGKVIWDWSILMEDR